MTGTARCVTLNYVMVEGERYFDPRPLAKVLGYEVTPTGARIQHALPRDTHKPSVHIPAPVVSPTSTDTTQCPWRLPLTLQL